MRITPKVQSLLLVVFAIFFLNGCDKLADNLLEDPGTMTNYRGNNGISYEFRITGDLSGTVWGGANGYYTDDSDLSTAAVHAGVLAAGQTETISVTIRPGQDNYFGSTANGVTTKDYGSWTGSYEFE